MSSGRAKKIVTAAVITLGVIVALRVIAQREYPALQQKVAGYVPHTSGNSGRFTPGAPSNLYWERQHYAPTQLEYEYGDQSWWTNPTLYYNNIWGSYF